MAKYVKLKNELAWFSFLAPTFTSVPSVVERNDGHFRVVGCKYNASSDLRHLSFLLINESRRVVNLFPTTTAIKTTLNQNFNSSMLLFQQTDNSLNALQTYQLPETSLLTSGFYQCGFDLATANRPILSKRSKFVPWPCK